MDKLRNLYMWPFVVTNTIIWGMGSLITSIFSARGARAWQPSWGRLNLWASRVKLQVEGVENLPDDGKGFVLASNHASASDIWAIEAGVPADVCWVAKAALLKLPFLGWHLKRVHIPVARRASGNTRKFLKDGAKKIIDGATVVIFPEGTRNRGDDLMLPFKKGAFLLAKEAKRPIVPVGIVGARELWPPGQSWSSPGIVRLRIGKPIMPQDFAQKSLEELSDTTRQAITELLTT